MWVEEKRVITYLPLLNHMSDKSWCTIESDPGMCFCVNGLWMIGEGLVCGCCGFSAFWWYMGSCCGWCGCLSVLDV